MKVKAKVHLFYLDCRKRVGEIFELAEEKHFSAKSMEKVSETEKIGKADPSKEDDVPTGFSGKAKKMFGGNKPQAKKSSDEEVI